MPLILFKETTELFEYTFEEGTAYDVQERLAVKYCKQMGIAVPVDSAENVQPNPMADYKFDQPKAATVKEAKPAPVPVVEKEETEPEVKCSYELKNRGKSPWFDVINVDTGEMVNPKPLRKSDAEALLNELVDTSAESSED